MEPPFTHVPRRTRPRRGGAVPLGSLGSLGLVGLLLAACAGLGPDAERPITPTPDTPPPDTPPPDMSKRHQMAVGLSPDRTHLALGTGPSDDSGIGGPLILYDLVAGTEAGRVEIHPMGTASERPRAIQFTADGERIVSLANWNTVEVRDLALRSVGRLDLAPMSGEVPSPVILGDRLLAWTDPGLVVVPMEGDHTDAQDPTLHWLHALFSLPADDAVVSGDRVVAANGYEAIALDTREDRVEWRTPLGRKINDHSQVRAWPAFTPDGRTLAAANAEGLLFIDTTTGTTIASGPSTGNARIAWDPQGARLVLSDESIGLVRVQSLAGIVVTLPSAPRAEPSLYAPDLRSVAFSPDGERLVVATPAGALEVYNLAAPPTLVARVPVTNDARDWLGVYWGANDILVAVTQGEVLLANLDGTIRTRLPIGYTIRSELYPSR